MAAARARSAEEVTDNDQRVSRGLPVVPPRRLWCLLGGVDGESSEFWSIFYLFLVFVILLFYVLSYSFEVEFVLVPERQREKSLTEAMLIDIQYSSGLLMIKVDQEQIVILKNDKSVKSYKEVVRTPGTNIGKSHKDIADNSAVVVPDKVDKIVMACCSLHNWLRKTNNAYINPSLVDEEDLNHFYVLGSWRTAQSCSLLDIQEISLNRSTT
nr:unnamed protein product [Callosobruchus analis]